ncbi:CDP-alcohol phosphatidyltransferase family protein [Candidatus Methylomirabilis sp.]|uniref:CDP-alcohol phosphatidyltransferase family protein n=1 Tax=Candidatus Methylomirabilis sp. TaxID=2032687 RepID=UPI002A6986F0|nr:CDP-alcohol phosphatidyltransferase family protein [Candidatus Methylomirabilis sp.]
MNKTKHKLPTLQEIQEAHVSRWWYEQYLPLNTYIFRPIGFRLTWIAVRMGLSSEAVSWMSAVVGLAGCVLLLSGSRLTVPVGLALLVVFNLLDCVDGDIARCMRTQNPYGRFLDSVCGGVIDLGFWAVVGVMAFRHPELLLWTEPFGYGPMFWLALGGITCFLCEILSFLEHRFDELLRPYRESRSEDQAGAEQHHEEISESDPAMLQGRQSAWPLRLIVATNLRVRETHYFLLVIAYLTSAVDVLLSLYLTYYLTHSLLLLGVYCIRGRQVRQSYLAHK